MIKLFNNWKRERQLRYKLEQLKPVDSYIYPEYYDKTTKTQSTGFF